MTTHTILPLASLRHRGRALASAIALCLLLAGRASAETAVTDRSGRVTSFQSNGEYLPIQTNLRIPLRGWGRQPTMADASDTKMTREGGRTTWQGSIEVEKGKRYRFEQALTEADGAVTLELRATAEAQVDIEGVFFWLDVPLTRFAGGEGVLSNGGNRVAGATLPAEKPQARHFLQGEASGLSLSGADGKTRLEVTCDRALPFVVQDNREWQGTTYSAFGQMARALAPGETTALKVTLKLALEPDQRPAALSMDAAKVRYHLDGFGGNYCFGIESPVTAYTLANLEVAWARTEMTLKEWEPRNDNASPGEADWAALEAVDTPDSNLRREFLLAKEIQSKGIPYVISVWDLPEWLYADPGSGKDGRRKVGNWPELLECIGSYLEYARRKYGVEPTLFSFNEADWGVRVLLSPEEHRDAIKRLGAHFRKLGLKTRLLLGDTAGPRGSHAYALPAAADPDAMQYVGALSFHSWGGGSAADYGAWGDLAERLKLPLLVAELGVDAGAWRTNPFGTYLYALQEVRMYQELLLHARPQGTMQWEFTSDYSTVSVGKDDAGKPVLTPTKRFFVVKHFCNLTPRGSDALATTSDRPDVLVTAFSGKDGLTLHLANLGAGRPATLSGLPRGIKSLRAIRTSESESFVELPALSPRDGKLELQLAPSSLLTLTTVR